MISYKDVRAVIFSFKEKSQRLSRVNEENCENLNQGNQWSGTKIKIRTSKIHSSIVNHQWSVISLLAMKPLTISKTILSSSSLSSSRFVMVRVTFWIWVWVRSCLTFGHVMDFLPSFLPTFHPSFLPPFLPSKSHSVHPVIWPYIYNPSYSGKRNVNHRKDIMMSLQYYVQLAVYFLKWKRPRVY